MTLEDHFQKMMQGAYGAQHPPIHVVQQLRRSFMTGAACFFSIVTSLADTPQAEDEGMEALSDELNRFAANVNTLGELEDYSDE